MKFSQLLLMLLAILAAAIVVLAQQPSVDQFKQIMEKSLRESHNIYYSRSEHSDIIYSNASLKGEFDAYKVTDGKTDLINQAGLWSSNLTDEENRQAFT